MTECVVDTSVASFMLDERPEFQQYRADIGHEAIIYLSFQTVAELRFGALNNHWGAKRMRALESFIGGLEIVGYTDELASRWAQVMHSSKRSGRRLEAGDAWIAATTLLLDVPLITHDRDFANLAELSISVVCHA